MPLIYAPDADPRTPGLITAGSNLRPTAKGFAVYPDYIEISSGGIGTVTGTPVRSLWGAQLSGATNTARLYAAGDTRITEITESSIGIFSKTDVSKGGSAYSIAGATLGGQDDFASTWAFTSYGTIVFTSNKATTETALQIQTTSGSAFTALAGSPPAGCLETFKDFIIAGNCGTYGSVTGTFDMVAWSALGDYTSWVPSASTQAGNQRLTDSYGPITAVKRLADAVIVYKSRAIYIMRYVDNVTLFSFQRVSDKIGCRSWDGYPPAIVDIGNAHIFIGHNDIYLFDGTRPVSITEGVLEYIRSLASQAASGSLSPSTMSHDNINGDIYFWGYGLSYNYRYGKWGILDAPATNATFTGSAATLVLNGAQPAVEVGTMISPSQAGTIKARYSCFVSSTYSACTLYTGDIGDNARFSTLSRVTPVFSRIPTAGTMTYYYKDVLGATATISGAGTITMDATRYRFDSLGGHSTNRRWHQAGFAFTGNMELVDITPRLLPGGAE